MAFRRQRPYVYSVPPENFPKLVAEGRVDTDNVMHLARDEHKE